MVETGREDGSLSKDNWKVDDKDQGETKLTAGVVVVDAEEGRAQAKGQGVRPGGRAREREVE